MNLQPLCSAQCAEMYYDHTNNWLFVEWMGELTLEQVQHTSLAIARCFLGHYYPRVLSDNTRVTSVTWEVTQWLASDFLPTLTLTGVEQLAWVVPAALRARNGVLDSVNLFPHVSINLFDEIELAVAWLQQTAPEEPQTGCYLAGRSYADELKFRHIVASFAQRLAAAPGPAQARPGWQAAA